MNRTFLVVDDVIYAWIVFYSAFSLKRFQEFHFYDLSKAKRMMKAPDWLPYWAVILIQMKMMTIMIRMRNQKDLMVTTISKKTMMNNKMERAHLLNLVHLGKFYFSVILTGFRDPPFSRNKKSYSQINFRLSSGPPAKRQKTAEPDSDSDWCLILGISTFKLPFWRK